MDHLQAKEITCKHCHEVFPSKGKYDYHFRRIHQKEVTIHSQNQEEISIPRLENEKFACICNKGYHVRQSLRRHQKKCQQWKDHEIDHDMNSDSEISIQGNIYIHYILINI